VYLIDLRAQFEAQLRHLTAYQRSLELYRAARGHEGRVQYRHEMLQQLRLLEASNTEIERSLTEAERQTSALRPEESAKRTSRSSTPAKSTRRRSSATR
jgi:hypothetical protein